MGFMRNDGHPKRRVQNDHRRYDQKEGESLDILKSIVTFCSNYDNTQQFTGHISLPSIHTALGVDKLTSVSIPLTLNYSQDSSSRNLRITSCPSSTHSRLARTTKVRPH